MFQHVSTDVRCFFSEIAQSFDHVWIYVVHIIQAELRSSPGLRGARDMSWLSSAMAMATDKVWWAIGSWGFHQFKGNVGGTSRTRPEKSDRRHPDLMLKTDHLPQDTPHFRSQGQFGHLSSVG